MTFEQHFYATDEFPEVRRGMHSDYRTVAVSGGVPRSLLDEIQANVALGSPGPELLAALGAAQTPRVTAVGCWPLDRWVVVSRALAFADEPNARPWTYFVHSLLVDAETYGSAFGANPFRVLRLGLFAQRPPEVVTGDPLRIEALTVTVDARSGAGEDNARAAGAVAGLAKLVGPATAAGVFRAAGLFRAGEGRVLLSADLAPTGRNNWRGCSWPCRRPCGGTFPSGRTGSRASFPTGPGSSPFPPRPRGARPPAPRTSCG